MRKIFSRLLKFTIGILYPLKSGKGQEWDTNT